MSQVAAAVQRIIAPISEDLLAVDREVIDDLQSDIPLIKKISDYIVTAGGKRMRLNAHCTRSGLPGKRAYLPCNDD